MVILEALLVIMVAVIAPLLWVDVNLIKHNKIMEDLNVKHAQDMQKLHQISGNLFQGDNRFIITYLVPTPYQPKWARLFNRIRIYPYVFQYGAGASAGDEGPPSKYTKTISKSKWFYMQLKDWSETEDREAAVDAMKYLQWKREIP